MERSMALKSPSIHYHLAGTKKVQQELAKPGQLERFLGDKAELIEQVIIGIIGIIRCGCISVVHPCPSARQSVSWLSHRGASASPPSWMGLLS